MSRRVSAAPLAVTTSGGWSGRSGWMKFSQQDGGSIFGAAINFNSAAGTNAGAFNQGHNLHVLTLTNSVSITSTTVDTSPVNNVYEIGVNARDGGPTALHVLSFAARTGAQEVHQLVARERQVGALAVQQHL